MKICDRCKGIPVVKVIRDQMDGTEVDLCVKCKDDFEVWMGRQESKKTGRPKKAEECP